MRRVLIVGLVCLGLGGCATLQADLAKIHQVIEVVTTKTVSPTAVVVAANTFDALKATAVNYGRYCIQGKFVDAICSADNRRAVIKAVRAGTAARNQLESSITTNTPAAATIYNLLVTAITALQQSPAITNFKRSTQ